MFVPPRNPARLETTVEIQDMGPGGPKCATSAQRLACEHMRRVSTEGRIERCACSVCGESLSRPVQWPFMAPKRVEVAL